MPNLSAFDRTTLLARAVESFHAQKKSQFDKLTRHATRGSNDIAMSRMSPEKLSLRLAEYQRDIEASEQLLKELRTEIVSLAEGTRRENRDSRDARNSREVADQ